MNALILKCYDADYINRFKTQLIANKKRDFFPEQCVHFENLKYYCKILSNRIKIILESSKCISG